MGFESDAVFYGIITSKKINIYILRAISRRQEQFFRLIRNLVVDETAAQKARLTEAEIKSAVYRICNKRKVKEDKKDCAKKHSLFYFFCFLTYI